MKKSTIIIFLLCSTYSFGQTKEDLLNAILDLVFIEDGSNRPNLSKYAEPLDTTFFADVERALLEDHVSYQQINQMKSILNLDGKKQKWNKSTLDQSKVVLRNSGKPSREKPLYSISKPVVVDDFMLIEVIRTCGNLCGSGNYRLYRLVDGKLQLVAQTLPWIS